MHRPLKIGKTSSEKLIGASAAHTSLAGISTPAPIVTIPTSAAVAANRDFTLLLIEASRVDPATGGALAGTSCRQTPVLLRKL